jgi:hypothetical protein
MISGLNRIIVLLRLPRLPRVSRLKTIIRQIIIAHHAHIHRLIRRIRSLARIVLHRRIFKRTRIKGILDPFSSLNVSTPIKEGVCCASCDREEVPDCLGSRTVAVKLDSETHVDERKEEEKTAEPEMQMSEPPSRRWFILFVASVVVPSQRGLCEERETNNESEPLVGELEVLTARGA